MAVKIAIVDDELHCIESLVLYLSGLFPEAVIAYKSNKVHEALEKLPGLEIDLLFLDIEMPGMNGFELLKQLPDWKFDVIFTTAYSQYAIQAFKARAINYLLKPIDEQELKEAVETWKDDRSHLSAFEPDKISLLIEQIKKEGMMRNKVSVPVIDGYEFIEVNDLMYCSSKNNYTTFHFAHDRKLLVSKTIKEIEKTLEQFYFIRVHQSFLLNPNYMKKYTKSGGGFIEMENEDKIPVSNSRKQAVISLFESIKRI